MLYPEESLGTLREGRRAASVVFFIDACTKEVLLGKHTRGPFLGQWSGPGGKFEKEYDDNMRDCTIREGTQELGLEDGVLVLTRLSLIGVLVCFNDQSPNRRVPIYSYTLDDKKDLPFGQGADGMDEISRYAHDQLPFPLKGGVQEMVDHVTSGSVDHLFLRIANHMCEGRICFDALSTLSHQEYTSLYEDIMQVCR